MTEHATGTREEWLAARLELLKEEKELTRRGDEVARRRQELPWVRMDKPYRFEHRGGHRHAGRPLPRPLAAPGLPLHVRPRLHRGMPACSAIADGFNGARVHLANHDVMFWAISRAPLPKLQAYKRRMGWSFPWASSYGSDFNLDFHAGFTEEQQRDGRHRVQLPPRAPTPRAPSETARRAAPPGAEFAAMSGVTGRRTPARRPG